MIYAEKLMILTHVFDEAFPKLFVEDDKAYIPRHMIQGLFCLEFGMLESPHIRRSIKAVMLSRRAVPVVVLGKQYYKGYRLASEDLEMKINVQSYKYFKRPRN